MSSESEAVSAIIESLEDLNVAQQAKVLTAVCIMLDIRADSTQPSKLVEFVPREGA
jgi:hypothetical protein